MRAGWKAFREILKFCSKQRGGSCVVFPQCCAVCAFEIASISKCGQGSKNDIRGPSLQLSVVDYSVANTEPAHWKNRLRCPRCSSTLRNAWSQPSCSNPACDYGRAGF